MLNNIGITRMVTGVETALLTVDDNALKRIQSKQITPEELNELFSEADQFAVELLDNDYPHRVDIWNDNADNEVIHFEDIT